MRDAIDRPADAPADAPNFDEIPPATDADIDAECEATVATRHRLSHTRRTFMVTSADYAHEVTSRRGLTAAAVIRHEVEQMRSSTPETGEDRTIWEDGKFIAILRPHADGEPLVWTPAPEDDLTAAGVARWLVAGGIPEVEVIRAMTLTLAPRYEWLREELGASHAKNDRG